MNKSTNLKKQLMYNSILIISMVLIMMGIILTLITNKILLRDFKQHSEEINKAINEKVEQYINNPLVLIDQIEKHNKDNLIGKQTGANIYLDSIVKIFPYFEQIKIVNSSGDIIKLAPYTKNQIGNSIAFEKYFQEANKSTGVTWSQVYISEVTSRPTLTVIKKIDDYYIVADLDLIEFGAILKNEKFEGIKSIAVVDKAGIYIASQNSDDVEFRLQHPGFSMISHDNLGITTNNAIDIVESYYAKKITSTGWFIIIESNKSEIYKPIFQIAALTIISIFASILIFVSMVALNYRKINFGVQLLIEQANAIASGDYKIVQSEEINDEFKYLQDKLSEMGSKILARESEILTMNTTLEHRVAERTSQLETMSAMLQESNSILEEEIEERIKAENNVIELNKSLEEKIKDRTRQLIDTNEMLEETNANIEETNSLLESEIENHRAAEKILKQKEEQLIKAKVEAEKANNVKSQFLANMSHEIRTPLNGVMGILNLLKLSAANEEQKILVRIASSASDMLLTIINDILDLSKLEEGKVSITESAFGLNETVNDVLEFFGHMAETRNIKLQSEVDKSIPEVMIGDSIRIKQVMHNLISNAIKYTNEGNVLVKTEKLHQSGEKCSIKFSVSDTGVGLSEQQSIRLFDRFYQVESPSNGIIRGAGLGLSISKMLIELMNGEIKVESIEGEGSVFYFTLNLGFVDGNKDANLDKLTLENEFEGMEVLIVEDDEISSVVLSMLLEKNQINVTKAENGKEALEHLKTKVFDIVLMDVNMPILNGLQTTEIIRSQKILNRRGKQIPIISMSASAFEEDRKKCIEAGMDGQVAKPINIKRLLEIFRELK